MDKVHVTRDSRIICVYHGLSPPLCSPRTSLGILSRVHEYRTAVMVLTRVLVDDFRNTVLTFDARFRLEGVSDIFHLLLHVIWRADIYGM